MLYSDSIKPVEGGTGERGMVLVVDDEPTSRALLTRWLEHDGFAVESYENAEDFRPSPTCSPMRCASTSACRA